MTNLKSILHFVKENKKELLILKILVLIIINIWLILIFWKIIMLDGLNITNNNQALTKMQTVIQPVLQMLGLNILSPNTLKMVVLTSIIILSNLAVLYFSQMLGFIILGMCARYGYKSYNNYINKDTLNYYGFQQVKELNLEEKNEILKDFIKENTIKDETLIGFLQDKMNNLSGINKNELILNLNNNLLEYKQKIISQLVMNQKVELDKQLDEIKILKNSTQTQLNPLNWNWDINTMIKIGGVLLIVGAVIGGFYYFNSNAVKTAGEIGKKTLDGADKSSNIALEHSNQSSIQLLDNNITIANELKNDILSTKENISDLTNKIIEINKIVENQNNNMLEFTQKIDSSNKDFIKEVLIKQKDCIEISNRVIEQNVDLVKITEELTTNTQKINLVINKIEQNLTETSHIVSNVHTQINGGKELYTDGGLEETNVPSLIKIVSNLTETEKGNTQTIRAILTFLGVEVELSELGLNMIERIREVTRREDVYQIVLESENLDNIEPIDNSEVDNIYQNER